MTLPTGTDGFVVFDHVQKSYDGQTLVVKDLNLSIGKGEFLTMLGPSGSGKSTLAKCLLTLEPASAGRATLEDALGQEVGGHSLQGQ